MRIDNGISLTLKITTFPVTLLIRDFMMIRHQNRKPMIFGIRDFFHRRNSIITGYDGVNAGLDGICDQMQIETITIRDSVRYGYVNIRPAAGQSPI